jgi:hypothetical protein
VLHLLSFSGGQHEKQLAAQPAPIAALVSHAAMMVSALCAALRESLAAHRRYEHLRSRGYYANTAIRDAFGLWDPGDASEDQRGRRGTVSPSPIGIARSQPRHDGAMQLRCARAV